MIGLTRLWSDMTSADGIFGLVIVLERYSEIGVESIGYDATRLKSSIFVVVEKVSCFVGFAELMAIAAAAVVVLVSHSLPYSCCTDELAPTKL